LEGILAGGPLYDWEIASNYAQLRPGAGAANGCAAADSARLRGGLPTPRPGAFGRPVVWASKHRCAPRTVWFLPTLQSQCHL